MLSYAISATHHLSTHIRVPSPAPSRDADSSLRILTRVGPKAYAPSATPDWAPAGQTHETISNCNLTDVLGRRDAREGEGKAILEQSGQRVSARGKEHLWARRHTLSWLMTRFSLVRESLYCLMWILGWVLKIGSCYSRKNKRRNLLEETWLSFFQRKQKGK